MPNSWQASCSAFWFQGLPRGEPSLRQAHLRFPGPGSSELDAQFTAGCVGMQGLAALTCEKWIGQVECGRHGQRGGSREVQSWMDLYTGIHPFPTTQKKGGEYVHPLRRFFQDPSISFKGIHHSDSNHRRLTVCLSFDSFDTLESEEHPHAPV